MKRYKLLKDLPTFNAGDEFELRDDGCLYFNPNQKCESGHWKDNVMAYHRRTLEHFPNILKDWFEEIDESKGVQWVDVLGANDGRVVIQYSNEEEAEEAVEKLKAWKRLKEKGFEFQWVNKDIGSIKFAFFNKEGKITKEMWQDIDICFGGEE